MAGKIITDKGAAQILGKSQITLIRWRKSNEGPPFRKVGGRYEYRDDLVEAWREGDRTLEGLQDRPFPPLGVKLTGGNLTTTDILQRVEAWRQQELSRRAASWNVDEPSEALLAASEKLRKTDALIRDKTLCPELLQDEGIATFIVRLMESAGVKVQEPMVFSAMAMLGAWARVIATHDAWRRGDFSNFPKAR